ncbi:alpha/beta hydrolase, partial [Streptosporangium algeriense]
MNDIIAMRPAEPNWSTVTAEELIAFRDAENRLRASAAARVITGEPDPGATIGWRQVALPGRELPVRVY